MMRALRQHIGWLFFLLVVVPFMGWMVFDVGMGVTGQSAPSSNPTVLEIDGTDIRFQEWDVARRQAYEQARQQQGMSPTNREDQEELEDRLVDQLVQQVLLQHEYRRLGIGVSDEEIVQAARLAPPPEVMSAPDFQSNGQFDQSKWELFLASGAARELLLALEARYRQQIPESKLVQRIVADVYVSEAKLWRMYRDAHDSVSVRLLRVTPDQVPPDAVTIAESEVRAYYDSHQDDFKRPATAVVNFVAVDRRPNASDSAEALATARRIRDEVSRPGAGSRVDRFAEAARRESRDTVSGSQGGDLGWVKRGIMTPPFEAALFRLPAGQISQPVATQFGYHVILAERVTRDSIKARHILVPIELAGQHLDQVDSRVDSLDRYVADQPGGGSQLDTVARRMGLPVGHAELREDQPLLLGRYRVPDVHLWAFEATPGSTSPVIEGQVAFYVFRLDSLQPAGVAPLDEVRAMVTEAVRRERQMAEARKIADQVAVAVARTRSLAQAAQSASAGRPVESLPPFTRTRPPPAMSGELALLGAAFGLRVGEVSGLIAGEHGFYFLESVARRGADSTAWRAQLATQREQVLADARQARVQMYVGALRDQAKIEDRRKEVYKPQPELPSSP
jgi:peptidyl-prolyl cis-trans isomerase D